MKTPKLRAYGWKSDTIKYKIMTDSDGVKWKVPVEINGIPEFYLNRYDPNESNGTWVTTETHQ